MHSSKGAGTAWWNREAKLWCHGVVLGLADMLRKQSRCGKGMCHHTGERFDNKLVSVLFGCPEGLPTKPFQAVLYRLYTHATVPQTYIKATAGQALNQHQHRQ